MLSFMAYHVTEGGVYVDELLTFAPYKGKGFASYLLSSLPRNGRTQLRVKRDNWKALRLYRKKGMKECKRGEFYPLTERERESYTCMQSTTPFDPPSSETSVRLARYVSWADVPVSLRRRILLTLVAENGKEAYCSEAACTLSNALIGAERSVRGEKEDRMQYLLLHASSAKPRLLRQCEGVSRQGARCNRDTLHPSRRCHWHR